MRWDSVWINTNLATFANEKHFGLIRNAAIAAKDGKICWLGKQAQLPAAAKTLAHNVINLSGKWLLPGLIDCHTHLAYVGNRSREFEWRLQGKSYAEIARQGGGILATVATTRKASQHKILQHTFARLYKMMESGVTTVEIKSGYGLDFTTEAQQLCVAQQLAYDYPVTIKKTYLGAHAVPEEFAGNAAAYIDEVCYDYLPRLHAMQLVDAVDVFCETIAFDLRQTVRVLQAASELGLPVKMHAAQFGASDAAKLAACYQALSVDHGEYLTEDDIAQLADVGTVVTLLPGAYYYLQATKPPPVALLRQYGVPMAIATDCNPGSSPCIALLLMVNMACVLFGLTPLEALQGVTINAAKALGLQQRLGSLELHKQADFTVWDIKHPRDLVADMSVAKPHAVIRKGCTNWFV